MKRPKKKPVVYGPPRPTADEMLISEIASLRLAILTAALRNRDGLIMLGDDVARVVIDHQHSTMDGACLMADRLRSLEYRLQDLNSAIHSVASSTERAGHAIAAGRAPWPVRWWDMVWGWWFRRRHRLASMKFLDRGAELKQKLDRLPQASAWGSSEIDTTNGRRNG